MNMLREDWIALAIMGGLPLLSAVVVAIKEWFERREARRSKSPGAVPFDTHFSKTLPDFATGGFKMLPPEVDIPTMLWLKESPPANIVHIPWSDHIGEIEKAFGINHRTHTWQCGQLFYTPNGPVDAPHPKAAEPDDDRIKPDDADNQLGWKR